MMQSAASQGVTMDGAAGNGYRAALTTPGAPILVLWSLLGRLAYAMTDLSTLLYVEAATGSFGLAGAMTAAGLVGTAAGSVVQGRMIDRFGPSRPLVALAAVFSLASVGLVLLVQNGVTGLGLAGVVAAHGATRPLLAAASRSMWPQLIPPGPRRETAYGYETVSYEACYLVAPLVAGTLSTTLWPGSGLVAAVAMVVVAAVGFAAAPAARAWRGHLLPPKRARPSSPLLRARGLHTVLIAGFGFGIGIGFVAVAVPAAAAAEHVAWATGLLLAIWSVSGVLGGLLYGRRPRPRPPEFRLPLLTTVFALMLLEPALMGGVFAVAVGMVLAGATLTPQATAQTSILDHLVPPTRLTEAYAWWTTLLAAGNATGQAIGGSISQEHGPRMAFLVGSAGTLALSGIVWIRYRTLRRAAAIS